MILDAWEFLAFTVADLLEIPGACLQLTYGLLTGRVWFR
jgi:hypothetical protein